MIELGKDPEQSLQRDAVHVSVMTVQMANKCWLEAGDKVCFTNDSLEEVYQTDGEKYHAIVDPFWSGVGSWVNIILRPGFVKNMRHTFDLQINDLVATGSEEDRDECRFC